MIPAEIASGRCCAAGEAGKKGLTRGPGASERGRATLRWGNGANGWARPVIRLARARAEGASGLSGVGARGGPGRMARGRGKGCWARALGWTTRGDVGSGAWGLAGPGKRKAELGHWVGLVEFGFGLGFVSSFSILFLYSFLFLIQTKFEFKYKFEFKPHSNN